MISCVVLPVPRPTFLRIWARVARRAPQNLSRPAEESLSIFRFGDAGAFFTGSFFAGSFFAGTFFAAALGGPDLTGSACRPTAPT